MRRRNKDRKKHHMVGVNGKSFVLTVSEPKKIPYRTEGTWSVNSPLKRATVPRRQRKGALERVRRKLVISCYSTVVMREGI